MKIGIPKNEKPDLISNVATSYLSATKIKFVTLFEITVMIKNKINEEWQAY